MKKVKRKYYITHVYFADRKSNTELIVVSDLHLYKNRGHVVRKIVTEMDKKREHAVYIKKHVFLIINLVNKKHSKWRVLNGVIALSAHITRNAGFRTHSNTNGGSESRAFKWIDVYANQPGAMSPTTRIPSKQKLLERRITSSYQYMYFHLYEKSKT